MEQSVRRIMTTFAAGSLALLGVVLLSNGTLLWGILLVSIGGGLVLFSLLAAFFDQEGAHEGCFMLLLWRIIRISFG